MISKQELIQSAQRCIREKGLNNLTLKAVAEGAGVTQGTVYYHFKTKEQLIFEIVQAICNDSWETIEKSQQTRDIDEAMLQALESARSRCTHDSVYHTLFFSLVVHSLQNDTLRAKLNEMITFENSHLAGLLSQLLPTAPEHSLKYRAIMLNALIDGLALQALLNPDFPAPEVYAELLDLFGQLKSSPSL
jgi:AcrR family transcriptional regulator